MEAFRCFFAPLDAQFLRGIRTIQRQDDFLFALAGLPDCLFIAVNHVVRMGIVGCAGRRDILPQRAVMFDHRRRFVQQLDIRKHQFMVSHIRVISFDVRNVDVFRCDDVVNGHDLH